MSSWTRRRCAPPCILGPVGPTLPPALGQVISHPLVKVETLLDGALLCEVRTRLAGDCRRDERNSTWRLPRTT